MSSGISSFVVTRGNGFGGTPRRVVVWSTHRMEEVRDVCDKVIHLAAGRLAACADVDGWEALNPEPVEIGGGA